MIRPNASVMLEVRDLTAKIEDRTILKGIHFTVRAGEVHAIMGPMARERAHSQKYWQGIRLMKSCGARSCLRAKIC